MDNDQLKSLFDSHAPQYEVQWVRMAAMNNALYFLLESVFAELSEDARILCVGVARGLSLSIWLKSTPTGTLRQLRLRALCWMCVDAGLKGGVDGSVHFL